MDIHYGLIRAEKVKSLTLPANWPAISWSEVTRDAVKYKMMVYLSTAPDSLINQLDYKFNSGADYNTWLNSTDIIPTLKIILPISAKDGFTRTAGVCNLDIDLKSNAMAMTVCIRSYLGDVEQKQAFQQVDLNITGAFYGMFIVQLQSALNIVDVIKNIITQKDSEGAL